MADTDTNATFESKEKSQSIQNQNSNQSDSITTEESKILEEILLEHLEEIVEIETKVIRNKLNLAFSLNENLYSLGYIMDIDMVEITSLYTTYELEELFVFLSDQLMGTTNNRNFPFSNFPKAYLDVKKSFYSCYCKWLYRLERIFHYNENHIPMSFKKFLFQSEKSDKKEKDDKEEIVEKNGNEDDGEENMDEIDIEEDDEEEGKPKTNEKTEVEDKKKPKEKELNMKWKLIRMMLD